MPSVDAALEAGKMLTMMGIIFGGYSYTSYFDNWRPRILII